MSTASIIVIIVILLGVLVSYAFVQQTVQAKREQRIRLTSALKSRSRSFKFMLNGFPQGFLTKELKILVQRSLADVCEQLSKLDPGDPSHLQDLQIVNSQMAETQRQAPVSAPPTLDNPQQIKDVRACLEELHKYIYKLEAKQTIPRNQAQVFRNQIKALSLQVSVDGHVLNGNQARQAGKTKLAIHYFDLAQNLIVRESKSDVMKKRLDQIKAIVAQLKERLTDEEQSAPISAEDQDQAEEVQGEWDKFSSDQEDIWKKKNVYD
ncbi:MAG: hypothetical protein K6L80_05865 [Agarilytica sp.]